MASTLGETPLRYCGYVYDQETRQYDHNGIRTKKTKPDGSYTCYEMVAGKAVGETRYNAAGNVSLYMRYTFDESGNVVGISLWYPGDTVWTDYYFAKNLQGDVLAVYAASDNTCVAAYTYDSWGNILTQYGSLADINPFRYRGYYYDNESWFYYLQSRYYDPAIGRFINADSYASTGQGILGNNMFAYCANNPVNFLDPSGTRNIWFQLFEDHNYGYIHRMVQAHILAFYNTLGVLTKEFYIRGVGRADIVDLQTKETWENKHGGSTTKTEGLRTQEALNQLDKYLGGATGLVKGAAGKFHNFFIINYRDYSTLVFYHTPVPGVILYHVFPCKGYELDPYVIYEKSTASATFASSSPAPVVPGVMIIIPVCGSELGAASPLEKAFGMG